MQKITAFDFTLLSYIKLYQAKEEVCWKFLFQECFKRRNENSRTKYHEQKKLMLTASVRKQKCEW